MRRAGTERASRLGAFFGVSPRSGVRQLITLLSFSVLSGASPHQFFGSAALLKCQQPNLLSAICYLSLPRSGLPRPTKFTRPHSSFILGPSSYPSTAALVMAMP
jgi:hypothetical protein